MRFVRGYWQALTGLCLLATAESVMAISRPFWARAFSVKAQCGGLTLLHRWHPQRDAILLDRTTIGPDKKKDPIYDYSPRDLVHCLTTSSSAASAATSLRLHLEGPAWHATDLLTTPWVQQLVAALRESVAPQTFDLSICFETNHQVFDDTDTFPTMSCLTVPPSENAWLSSPLNDDEEEKRSLSFRERVAFLTRTWAQVLAEYQDESDETKDQMYALVGLSRAEHGAYPWWTTTTPAAPFLSHHQGELDHRITYASFNLWHGGTGRSANHRHAPSTLAAIIRQSGATMVGLQEAWTYERDESDGVEDTFVGHAIAAALGPEWKAVAVGMPIAHEECFESVAFLYKKRADGTFTLLADQLGLRFVPNDPETPAVTLFNVHMPYLPYEIYRLLHIDYEPRDLFFDHAAEAAASSAATRGPYTDTMVQRIKAQMRQGDLVLVTGDFNEPSALDWTPETTLAGYAHGVVPWAASTRLQAAGLVDVYRERHPDALREPGFTWSTLTTEFDQKDHHDRIDFNFAGADTDAVAFCVEASEVFRLPGETPWFSDHYAVVSTLHYGRRTPLHDTF